MAIEIKMPQLSDTMDSGKILSWNKNEGDSIERGDILAEVETDKANLEIESFHQGTLIKILTPAEQTANVGEIIAYIGEVGESVGEEAPPENGSQSSSDDSTEQEQLEPARREAAPPQQEAATAKKPEENPAPTTAAPEPQYQNGSASNTQSSGRIIASPLAKKIAEEKNIDLTGVSGSGPQGRIIKRDLESQKPAPGVQPAASPQQPAPAHQQQASSLSAKKVSSVEGGSLTPMTKMRAAIAKRMQQSVVESPHFYVTTSVKMDEVIKLRKLLKEKGGYEAISFNHFILKAVAYGLAHEPRVNCSVRDGEMVYDPGQVNIGIITAVDDGLLIPVLHNVTEMSLKDVVFEARALIDRARVGRPTSEDLSGGTFSISNMGMFDIESFTAIINPGQGAILAVSSISEQPVVDNGQIVPASVMKATVSVDHRIIDGVMAGNFLKYFTEGLENPALLMA